MTINTVLIERVKNSSEVLSAKLKNIADVVLLGCFEDFSSLNNNLEQIDLIIFDIKSDDSNETIEKIKEIQRKNSNILFIAVSYEINSELTAKILNTGVKDFLLKPVIDSVLEASIKKIKDAKNNINQALSNVISVFSNKGGCGKTSLAVNLAYEISEAEKDKKVCLLDLNYNSGDASTFLNLEPKYDIDYILSKFETSDEKLALSLLNNYKNSNLYVCSLNNNMSVASKLTVQNASKIINYLKNSFRWIIIDTSSIINETNVCVLYQSDLILYTGIQNMSSLRNSQKCFEMFNSIKFKDEKIKFIINRYTEKSEITTEDIERATSKKIFGKIPNNYLTLVDAINIGQPVGEINPQSNIANAYKKIAKEIINTDYTNLAKADNDFNHGIYNLLKRMGE